MFGDKPLVHHVLLDENVRHGVQDGQIVAGGEGDVQISDARGGGAARIDDDHLDVPLGLLAPHDALKDDRVRFRRVAADEQEDIGVIDVLVATHGLVLAKGGDIAAHPGGHAEARIALHVVGANPRLEELVGAVRFLRETLAGAVKRHAVRAVLLDALFEAGGHQRHCLVPRSAHQLAVFAHPRVQAAVGGGEDLRQQKPFQAQKAAVVVVLVAAHGKHLAVPHADKQAPSRATVATDALHPRLTTARAGGRCLAHARQGTYSGHRRGGGRGFQKTSPRQGRHCSPPTSAEVGGLRWGDNRCGG